MNKNRKILLIFAVIVTAVLVPIIIFNVRAPVIIVTEQSLTRLYGEDRIRRESLYSSFRLFRPVKTVIVANDAGDDIVPHAVSDVSLQPYCVLFPLRFARSAAIYQEQNPETRIIILKGNYPGEMDLSYGRQVDFFVYRTDLEADFFKAGFVAAALAAEAALVAETEGNNGGIAVFMENRQFSHFGTLARDAFIRGVNRQFEINNMYGNHPVISFYTSFHEYTGAEVLSCVVVAGSGYEYFERKDGVPVIFYSWLDTSLAPSNVVAVIDDSPWAQVIQAVTLVSAGDRDGKISSKFTILNNRNINLRKIIKID
jgi:hypothetical protein